MTPLHEPTLGTYSKMTWTQIGLGFVLRSLAMTFFAQQSREGKGCVLTQWERTWRRGRLGLLHLSASFHFCVQLGNASTWLKYVLDFEAVFYYEAKANLELTMLLYCPIMWWNYSPTIKSQDWISSSCSMEVFRKATLYTRGRYPQCFTQWPRTREHKHYLMPELKTVHTHTQYSTSTWEIKEELIWE